MTFLLNVNDGQDTVHDLEHLTESCNTDDIEGRQSIDGETADALVALGQAVRCKHCSPEAPIT